MAIAQFPGRLCLHVIRIALVFVLLIFGVGGCFASNPAVAPEPRDGMAKNYNRLNERVKDAKSDLVFVGDSITHRWGSIGKEVWREYYGEIHPVNLGISGDRTESILWRMQNGNLDGKDPKMVVVLAGTNNIHRDSAKEIAEGVEAIVEEILTRCPSSQVLLMGVFPRSANPKATEREKIEKINRLLALMDNDPRVVFLDISDQLAEPDGSLSKERFPDALHPSEEGYRIWAQAMDPYISGRINQ